MAESQGAARRYSWPPFEPGHSLSTTHGANSAKAIEAQAALVHEQLLELAPWCDQPHFLPSVDRYLRAASREALLHQHITTLSATKGPAAVPSRVWEQATAATRLAHTLAGDLGLTPLGEARLRAVAGSAAVTEASLADMQSEGRRIRLAAQARIATTAAQLPAGGTEPAIGTPTTGDDADA
jgi:hypothetical protein